MSKAKFYVGYDDFGNIYKVWSFIKDASLELGILPNSITSLICSKCRNKKTGLRFKSFNNEQEILHKIEPYISSLENGYQHLIEYKKQLKSCNAPRDYISPDGYPLGNWANSVRYLKKNNKLPKDFIEKMDNLGFQWIRYTASINLIIGVYKDDGNLLKIHYSREDVLRKYQITVSSFNGCIYHGNRTKCGLRFIRYEKREDVLKKIEPYKRRNPRFMPKNLPGYIYKITNNKNNFVYIGQTVKQDPKERWQQHIGDAKNGSNLAIHKAIRKIGVKNFSFEIIEKCFSGELDERERYWINYYDSFNNGYNSTIGGQDYLIGKDAIPVVYYDEITGIICGEASSYADAIKKLKLPHGASSSISQCINKERYSAYGYVWKRKISDDYPKKIEPLRITLERLRKNRLKNAVKYIKRNINKKTIKEIQFYLKDNDNYLAWTPVINHLREKEKEIWKNVLEKQSRERFNGTILLNIRNLKYKYFHTQTEAGKIFNCDSGMMITNILNGRVSQKNIYRKGYLVFTYKDFLKFETKLDLYKYVKEKAKEFE